MLAWSLVAALSVKIVNADNGGLHLRDVTIPLATLLGGLVGVVLGARFTRSTTFAVERQKAGRDEQLERRQEARSRLPELRAVLGIARVMMMEMDKASATARRSIEVGWWWGDDVRLEPRVSVADQQLLAAEFEPATWKELSTCLLVLASADSQRSTSVAIARQTESTAPDRRVVVRLADDHGLKNVTECADASVAALRVEGERLTQMLTETTARASAEAENPQLNET